MQVLVLMMVFVTVVLFAYVIISTIFFRLRNINRLKTYFSMKQVSPSEHRRAKKSLTLLQFIIKRIGGLFIFRSYKKKIQAQLVKAHIPLKGEEFITLSLCTGAGAMLFITLALDQPVLGMLSGIPGWFIPALFIKARKKKRTKVLNDQLGDTITLISNSLKAGYSFFQAVDTISTEMSGCISEEFAQMKKEINFGLTTEKALENLVGRVESDDLELVVTAILIQRQVGGNLSEILDNISETIRERVRIKGEVRTITAQGRMSGMIIAVIPSAVGVLLWAINPEYIRLLFVEKIGLAMLGISVAMQLMGVYFISKIVKIEV